MYIEVGDLVDLTIGEINIKRRYKKEDIVTVLKDTNG